MKMKSFKYKTWVKYLFFVLLISSVILIYKSYQERLLLNQQKPSYFFSDPGWFYRIYPWKEQIQRELVYYPKSENEKNLAVQIQKITTVPTQLEKENQTETKVSTSTSKTSTKKIVTPPLPKAPNAIIHASLTGSPGSVAISGSSYKIEVIIDGVSMPEGNFQSSAANQFTLEIKSKDIQKIIRVSSPSFGTNMIVQSLTLSVNPVNNTASISGKLNLDLPGTMSGTLLNLTNGSSSTCLVHDGYFSTSVHLSAGNNQMTAIGKWLTITLELPSISVLLQ